MLATRRSLLLGTILSLSSAALPSMALAALPPSLPVLHADGETDDTEALNAFFSGGPVLHRGEIVGGEYVVLPRGTYLVAGTVRIDNPLAVVFDCDFVSAGQSGPAIWLRRWRVFSHNRIRTRQKVNVLPSTAAIRLAFD